MHAGARLRRLIVVVPLILAAANLLAAESSSPRQRLLMDFGWKFHLGNQWGIAHNWAKAGTGSGPASMAFSDASWRTVNLPHDWAVALPFDQHADAGHGFKPVGPGFPQTSVAWYRRTFELPKHDAGKRLWLEFDGVYRDCDVFVNGWLVGHHESGYDSFRYDITDVANYGGRNLVAVKVNASQFEGWFYEGAGIYRHVWLVVTNPLAIAPDGIFVYSRFKDNVPGETAAIHVRARLLNSQGQPAEATVRCSVVNPQGQAVASCDQSTRLPRWWNGEVKLATQLRSPELWSPESPQLYRLVTTVECGGKIVDRTATPFGIRTVAFDPNRGFLLNGKPYELKGTCNHQDAAGVGVAVPDALWDYRVRKLKEMGCNAYRTAHGEVSPELLQACDRLGLLVMDENRLLGSSAANLALLKGQIRRDRNHPSVAIWSIANEEFTVQDTAAGKRVAETMQRAVRRLDPTRPITYAAPVGDDFAGINSVIEVRGWNYHAGPDMDRYHAAHPGQPEVGTEQGSTVSTRGIYANDPARGYVSAYDTNAQPWSSTAEAWWSYFAPRPWLSGGFLWTGFDYRGEPTPYGWPCINSHFGVMDTCGFPKDLYYYYQAAWTDQPVLHLLPHWNWPGREGRDIDVWCFSNCRQVELFLNGKSLGRKTMMSNSHLQWTVPYEPGTLSARGYDGDGKLIATTRVETTGAPAAVPLTPDRATIDADGQDVSVVTVSVRDADNRVVPVADNLIDFQLEGPGRIIGVGNGDPSCHEPDVYLTKWPISTVALDEGWRWKKVADVNAPDLAEVRSDYDDSTWPKTDVASASGPLEGVMQAVFRARIQVTEPQLQSRSVELCFGMIAGDASVYVNGRKVGESHDSHSPPSFDVKRFLHPGENAIAVAVADWGGPGGVNQGVTLRLTGQPESPRWKRSVFNGLAQVLVQSTEKPGTIKLTATAKGLAPATLVIGSRPCTPPPSLP